MAPPWKDYQEETAEFFCGLGMVATTDERVRGVRTFHDIDVVVRSSHVGFEITWIVECKHWQTPVSKLHVLALREIVADTGADRGILLCEAGFQSGAIEAATLTNVHATSLATLRQSAGSEIYTMRLRDLADRTVTCKERYWEIPKEQRILRGLRPHPHFPGYWAIHAVELAEELVVKALRGLYPFACDDLKETYLAGKGTTFASAAEVLEVLEPLIATVETLLDDG